MRKSSQPAASSERYNQRSKKIVIQGVQLLFHAEYVTLVLYVESVVPIAFVVFKSVLECLPNVAYYPGGAGTWNIDSVLNVSLFAKNKQKKGFEPSTLTLARLYSTFELAYKNIIKNAHDVPLEMGIPLGLLYELQHFG
ncbi:unnamed protein product [Phytophthora fragariaefolia]|uniref:Unnamed protein product n=1 Tax=Phytophthora fragariaefolia TaxID=1490495 RepID=A0A9W6WYB3_9STRA|nr:unnamed protein product [Phytophthora fragariaefolia]